MTMLLRALSVGSLGLLLATQSGCLLVAAAAGTGATVAYISGDLNTSIAATPDKVGPAATRAMQKLQISVISSGASSVDAKVVGRTARDTKLTVTAKASNLGSSTLSIRAGTFGDDALQARLLEEIHSELGLTPATTARSAPATQPTVATNPPATQPMAGER